MKRIIKFNKFLPFSYSRSFLGANSANVNFNIYNDISLMNRMNYFYSINNYGNFKFSENEIKATPIILNTSRKERVNTSFIKGTIYLKSNSNNENSP